MTKADFEAHEVAVTGIHGVGVSTIDSITARAAAIAAHGILTTGIHGVGASVIDSVADRAAAIAVHAALASVHHTKTAPYTLEEHGADKHNNVTRQIFVEASGGHLATGPTYDLEKGSAVRGDANSFGPDVYLSMKVPPDFVSFQSVKAVWSGDGSGDMYWRMLASWAADNELKNTHMELTDWDTTFGNPLRINIDAHPDPLLLANLAAGDWLGIRFLRDGANALDTVNDIVRFAGLLFIYTASQ